MAHDTIDVQLHRSEDGNHYISLILNGLPVKGTFDAFDLISSTHYKHMLLELMTCSCGVPGCAGIFEGTYVKHRRFTVEWRDIDSGFPKKFYSFKVADYAAAVDKAKEMMYTIARERENGDAVSDDIDRYDRFYRFDSVTSLENILEYQKEWTKNYAVM